MARQKRQTHRESYAQIRAVFLERFQAEVERHGGPFRRMAAKLDVNETTFQRWYDGTVVPQLDYLVAIADLFDVTIDYLAGRTTARQGTGTPGPTVASPHVPDVQPPPTPEIPHGERRSQRGRRAADAS